MSDQIITIESLQVGQQVVIAHKYGPYTVETVTRITKTQIITDSDKRFSKKSGDVLGGTSFSARSWLAREAGGWWQLMSIETMAKLNLEAQDQAECKRLANKIANSSSRLNGMSLADLQTIASLMGLE